MNRRKLFSLLAGLPFVPAVLKAADAPWRFEGSVFDASHSRLEPWCGHEEDYFSYLHGHGQHAPSPNNRVWQYDLDTKTIVRYDY